MGNDNVMSLPTERSIGLRNGVYDVTEKNEAHWTIMFVCTLLLAVPWYWNDVTEEGFSHLSCYVR